MDGFGPTIGIEYDDKYLNAKRKLIDLAEALNKLTPAQREQLAREWLAFIDMKGTIEQFIDYLNNGGRA